MDLASKWLLLLKSPPVMVSGVASGIRRADPDAFALPYAGDARG